MDDDLPVAVRNAYKLEIERLLAQMLGADEALCESIKASIAELERELGRESTEQPGQGSP